MKSVSFLAKLSLAVAASTSVAAEPEFSDVFIAGRDGYKSIRIPSVIATKSGVVLAFAEGRAANADQAANDLVLRRSIDGGRTWGATQLVADDGDNSLNNPCAVVVRESGRVIVMFQSYPAGVSERSGQILAGVEGPNIVRNLLVWTDDDGITWSPALDVTKMTKRAERVTTVASGPGIGIQLVHGEHAGRLIVPFNEGPYGMWNVFAVFSDDRGRTWHIGEIAPGGFMLNAKGVETSAVNEVQMVELTDGSVRLSSRQFAGAKVRKTALSTDGGSTWSPITDLPDLRDPSCMAGLLRYSFDDGQGLGKILHTGPDSTHRDHGTVYLSLDDGATFPIKRELWPGKFAYSIPTRLPDGQVGVLFEADEYKRIVFARFPIAWLESK